uniref:Uncharacterized protein n=1 Tax=Timema bartmani TaxID=61472 RepID=A0A7R9EWR2_9NEOP|nr:unnamed protein product [Timema bartmani]
MSAKLTGNYLVPPHNGGAITIADYDRDNPRGYNAATAQGLSSDILIQSWRQIFVFRPEGDRGLMYRITPTDKKIEYWRIARGRHFRCYGCQELCDVFLNPCDKISKNENVFRTHVGEGVWGGNPAISSHPPPVKHLAAVRKTSYKLFFPSQIIPGQDAKRVTSPKSFTLKGHVVLAESCHRQER